MVHTFNSEFNIGDSVVLKDGESDYKGIVINVSYNVGFCMVEVFVMFPDKTKWYSEDQLKY